ncbi:mechanosensitive ion channel family protein [Neptuniibacter sp.]|uniref:mechanosensitive ion channel family protein n=1 Tax=Neptuniibacter sp. TaxID=1962643 RepID=UPI003B5AA64B
MKSMEEIETGITESLRELSELLVASATYIQIGTILGVYLLSFFLANQIKHKSVWVSTEPHKDSHPLRKLAFGSHLLVFPLLAIIVLKLVLEINAQYQYESWLIQFSLGVALMLFLNQLIKRFVKNSILAKLFQWIALPLMFLSLIGWLAPIISVLEQIRIDIGNFSISAYGLARVLIFGIFLFWFGRASSHFGRDVIRKQTNLDNPTKEIMAKLLEVALFTFVIMVLLNIMGINLTALAVFGGALGVGIGFGLQSIASNFISGIIILLDRSITVDDYIEFEGESKGYVREFRMRYTTLETFDGKFIMVPNEKFISNSFINWSHKDLKQRFRVDFSVAYKTDVRQLCEIIREAVSQHPQVICGEDVPFEERPDCEIDSFGDSGVNMFVEFWMYGIDDGKNRVGGDLMLLIFETLKEHDIEIPFPQREVRVLNEE